MSKGLYSHPTFCGCGCFIPAGRAGHVSTCTRAAPLPEGQSGSLPGPAPCWPLGTRGGKGPGPAFRSPSSPRNPSDPPASPQGLQLCPRGSCTLPAPAPPGQSACAYVFLMGEFINMRSLSRIHRRCLSVLPLRTSFVASSHTGNRRSWRGPGPRL